MAANGRIEYRPGDRLVIPVPSDWGPSQINDFAPFLVSKFPGAVIVPVPGATNVQAVGLMDDVDLDLKRRQVDAMTLMNAT